VRRWYGMEAGRSGARGAPGDDRSTGPRRSEAATTGVGSLAQLPAGAHVVVHWLRGGRGLAGRLAGMGLTVGSRVEVLQNRGHGPVLVRVRETRIGLGRREAAKVLVEEVPP
jgi:ferrous iron transport protein A